MEIVVPTSWQDVSVNQYQALAEIDKDKYKTDLAYTSAIIQVLCNIDNVNKLPLSAINEIAPLISFLSKEPETKIKKSCYSRGVAR